MTRKMSREEIEKLKKAWESDPDFDLLAVTPQEYHAELIAFEQQCNNKWRQAYSAKIAPDVEKIIQSAGLQNNKLLARYMYEKEKEVKDELKKLNAYISLLIEKTGVSFSNEEYYHPENFA